MKQEQKKRRMRWLVAGLFFILLIVLGAAGQKKNELFGKEKQTRAVTDITFAPGGTFVETLNTAPFDDVNKPGFVTEARAKSDHIVRSYDTYKYTYTLGLTAPGSETYTDVVLRISGKVIGGVSDDGRVLNAMVSTSRGGTYTLGEGGTSTFSYDQKDDGGGNSISTGSTIVVTIPIEVYGAENGTKLGFEMQAQIISAKDETGKVVNLEDQKIIKTFTPPKDVTVTSDVNLKVFMNGGYYDPRAPFNYVTRSEDDDKGMIMQLGVAVAMIPLEGRNTSMLGASAPRNALKINISQKIEKVNVNNSNQRETLMLGEDTPPIKIFDYGAVGKNYPVQNNTISVLYPNYIHIGGTKTLMVPYSKININSAAQEYNSAYNSGNLLMTEDVHCNINIKFQDYTLNSLSFPKTTTMGNKNTVTYNTHEKVFLSLGSYIYYSKQALEENFNLSYFLNCDSIEFINNGEEKKIYSDSSYSWSESLYPKGDINLFTVYRKENSPSPDNLLGTVTGRNIPSGDSKATIGQKIFVSSEFQNTGQLNPDETDILQKWNPTESELTAVYTSKPNAYYGEKVELKPIKYGVLSSGNYDIATLNNAKVNDYVWYDSIEEAKLNGEISAVWGGTIGKLATNNSTFLYTERIVKREAVEFGWKDKLGNPFVTISSGKMFIKEISYEREYPTKSNFFGTEYDDIGLIKYQTPNGQYGDSLLVVPYNLTIDKKAIEIDSETQQEKEQSSFSASATINWKLQPTITTEAKGELSEVDISVTDILPKGLEYMSGTGFYGDHLMEPEVSGPNEKGEYTLVWNFKAKPTEVLPAITYQTYTDKNKLNFVNEAATLVNRAIISSPLVNSAESLRRKDYTVTIIKDAGWSIRKEASNPLLEANDQDTPITFVMRIDNSTGVDMKGVKVLDVLPKHGDLLGTKFDGTYKLVGLRVLGDDKQTVDTTAKLYYSTKEIGRDTNPNTVEANNGLTKNWVSVQPGELDVPNAKAVYMNLPSLADGHHRYLEVKILPSNNKPGNVYINRASGNSDNIVQVTQSNTASAVVVNRTLKGQVWYDDNYNGRMDDNEPFKADVPVTLYRVGENNTLEKVKTNLNGASLEGKKTDKNGAYEFDALPLGDYVVGFDVGKEITAKELYLTKAFAPDVQTLVNSKVDGKDVDGTYYLTPIEKKFSMPTVNELAGSQYTLAGINLGVLKPPALTIDKAVYNNSEDRESLDGQTVHVGDKLYYELVVKNPNPNSYVENIQVEDQLPKGMKYVEGSLRVTTPETEEPTPMEGVAFDADQKLTTTLDAQGQSPLGGLSGFDTENNSQQVIVIGFEVEILPEASGQLPNTAIAKGTFQEEELDDDSETNNDAPPKPTLEKLVEEENSVQVNDILHYTLVVGNEEKAGNWLDVKVTDALEDYLEYVAGSTKIDGTALTPEQEAAYWKDGVLTVPFAEINGGKSHEITFEAQVKVVPSSGRVVNTVSATGKDGDGKEVNPPDDTVSVPAVDVLLHLRQVVLQPVDSLVVPTKGFFELYVQEGEDKPEDAQQLGLVTGSTKKHQEPEIADDLFTTRTIKLPGDLNGVRIRDIVPEYYEFIGYIVSADSETVAADHDSKKKQEPKEIYLDYNEHVEYWVTVFIQPKFGEQDNGEPETAPRGYSWDYKTNQFGDIQLP